ncbi:MAG TPA: hypothetical protein VMW50_03155 [Dehalococcoidia bacterium]|nr:hypothetical protein [Dehalococcoidia bacterium]
MAAIRYCSTLDVSILGQVEWQQLGFGSITYFNDWVHGTLIYKAMDFIDNYCRHNFQLNAGTITMDGTGKETQHIPPHAKTTGLMPPPSSAPLTSTLPVNLMPIPLMEITEIKIEGVTQTLTNFQTYTAHITHRDNVFAQGRQNVAVIATFGYGTIPHDIQYVCAELCSNIMADMIRRRTLGDLITPVLEGGGNLNMLFRSPKVLTENEKSILNKYRYHAMEIT